MEHLMTKNTHQITTLGATSSHKDVTLNARLLRQEPAAELNGWDTYASFSKPKSRVYKRPILPGLD
jgi:hypothetical protein